MKQLTYILSLFVVGLTPLDAITISEGFTFGRLFYILLLISSIFSKDLFPIKKQSYISLLFLFTIWAFLTSLWSYDIEASLYRTLYLLQYISLIIILENIINTPQKFIQICYAWILGTLFIGIQTIYNYMQYGFVSSELYRVSEFGNPNENSYMLCFATILYLLIKANKIKHYLFFLFAFITILANGSRTGLIMFLLIVIVFFLSDIKKNKIETIISLLIFGGIAFYFFFNYLPENTYERYMGIGEDIKNENLANRQWIWQTAFDILATEDIRIIFGSGWATFPLVFKQHTGIFYGSHNFYLNILFTTGIIGFSIVLYYFKILFNYLKKSTTIPFTRYLLLIIPCISMFTTNWEDRRWWFLLGFFIYKFYYFSKSNICASRN